MTRATAERHLLDVSGLPPPQPIERVLDVLADLPEGGMLKVRFAMAPGVLYRC